MHSNDNSIIDEILHRALTRTSAVSRRSFLHSGSTLLFRTVGLVLAARVLPYKTYAEVTCLNGNDGQGAPPLCGQHGNTCTSTSNCGNQGTSWKQCCKNPSSSGSSACATYTQCHYTDWCLPASGWDDPALVSMQGRCQGTLVEAGSAEEPAWCAGQGFYVCTSASCGGTFASLQACSSA